MDTTEKEIIQFYNSRAWKALRQTKLNKDPLCQTCLLSDKIVTASKVHHSLSIRRRWDDRWDIRFLFSLCDSCHSQIEADQKVIEQEEQNEALRKAEG